MHARILSLLLPIEYILSVLIHTRTNLLPTPCDAEIYLEYYLSGRRFLFVHKSVDIRSSKSFVDINSYLIFEMLSLNTLEKCSSLDDFILTEWMADSWHLVYNVEVKKKRKKITSEVKDCPSLIFLFVCFGFEFSTNYRNSFVNLLHTV
jgi:hypothetical protein